MHEKIRRNWERLWTTQLSKLSVLKPRSKFLLDRPFPNLSTFCEEEQMLRHDVFSKLDMISVINSPRRRMGVDSWNQFIVSSFNDGIPGMTKLIKDYNFQPLEAADIDEKLEAYFVAYLRSMVISNSTSFWGNRRSKMLRNLKSKLGDGSTFFLVPEATAQDFAAADASIAADRQWLADAIDNDDIDIDDDLHEVFAVGGAETVRHVSPVQIAASFTLDDV
jgi:hypothetical protein